MGRGWLINGVVFAFLRLGHNLLFLLLMSLPKIHLILIISMAKGGSGARHSFAPWRPCWLTLPLICLDYETPTASVKHTLANDEDASGDSKLKGRNSPRMWVAPSHEWGPRLKEKAKEAAG